MNTLNLNDDVELNMQSDIETIFKWICTSLSTDETLERYREIMNETNFLNSLLSVYSEEQLKKVSQQITEMLKSRQSYQHDKVKVGDVFNIPISNHKVVIMKHFIIPSKNENITPCYFFSGYNNNLFETYSNNLMTRPEMIKYLKSIGAQYIGRVKGDLTFNKS